MKFMIELTWSKIMALVVLGAALTLDITNKTASTFQYAVPFVVFLITGKQFMDLKKKPADDDVG
jgi:hypothetical protein